MCYHRELAPVPEVNEQKATAPATTPDYSTCRSEKFSMKTISIAVCLVIFLIAGCSDAAKKTAKPVVPSIDNVPKDIAIVDEGEGFVELSWSAVNNAENYKIYWATTDDVSAASPNSRTTTRNFLKVDGMDNGVRYYFVVSAVVEGVESVISDSIVAVPRYTIDVVAQFPGTPNWNDYVLNDSNPADHMNRFFSSGTKCDAQTAGLTTLDTCFHAGEYRKSVIPGIGSCDGVGVVDDNNQFAWQCIEINAGVEVYSTSLADQNGLSDLIDFDKKAWKDKSLTVVRNGVVYAESEPAKWWSNPIAIVPESDVPVELAGGTNIYLAIPAEANADIYTQFFEINQSGVVLVIHPSVTLTAPVQGSPNAVVEIANKAAVSFVWFEGAIDARQSQFGLRMDESNHCRVERAEIFNTDSASGTGIYSAMGRANFFRNIRVHDNANGLTMNALHSSDNRIHKLYSSNNSSTGLEISASNVVNEVVLTNNGLGLSSVDNSGNYVTTILAANNGMGLRYIYTGGNVIQNGSFVSNATSGVVARGSQDQFINTLAVHNNRGVEIPLNGGNSLFHGLFLNDNLEMGLYINGGSTGNVFSGLLNVGFNGVDQNNCHVGGIDGADASEGEIYGLAIGTSCQPDDPAIATAVIGEQTMAGGFVGVIDDDDVNDSDDAGPPAFDRVIDWTYFDYFFRAYGRLGVAIPDVNVVGRCDQGQCIVWDWQLHTAAPAFEVNDVTDANVAYEVDRNRTNSYFIQPFAVEILDDGIGNENGLCDREYESCIFSPNAGAYQGHGKLVKLGTHRISDSNSVPRLYNIELYRYESNGF